MSSSFSARPPRPSTNGGKRPKTVDQWCAEAETKSSLATAATMTATPRPPTTANNSSTAVISNSSNVASSRKTLTTAVPGISLTGNNRSVQSLQKILDPIATISNASIYHGSTRTTLAQQSLKSPRLLASVASNRHPPEELVPLHLRPFVASDAYKNIMHKFEQQRALFTSSVVCAETAFREVLDATAGEAKRGRPDPIRSAVACGLLKRLLPPPKENASAKLLHQLLGEMARAVFDVGDQDADEGASADSAARKKAGKKLAAEANIKNKNSTIGKHNNNHNNRNNTGRYPSSSSSSSDGDDNDDRNDYLDAQDDDINMNANSRLLQDDSFDQLMLRPLYFQQVARIRDELYISQASEHKLRQTIKKQSVILDQSITRWQQMLVRRIFVAWHRHTINYRPSKFEGRFRLLSSAKAKQLLTNSFLGWRYVVTAASLARAVEEIRFLKLDLARTQTVAAKVEKELHSEVNRMVETNDNLQATIAGLKEDISAISDQVEEERRRGDVAVQMGDRWRETCLKIVASFATGRRGNNNNTNAISRRSDNTNESGSNVNNNNNNNANYNNSDAIQSSLQYPEFMFMPEEILPVSFDFDMAVLQKAVVDVKMAKELGLLNSEQHQQEQQDQQQYANLMKLMMSPSSPAASAPLVSLANADANLDSSFHNNGTLILESTNNNNNNRSNSASNQETKSKKEIAAAAAQLSQLQRQIPASVLRVPVASEFIYKQPLVLSGLEELHGLLLLPDQEEFNNNMEEDEGEAVVVGENLNTINLSQPQQQRQENQKNDDNSDDVVSILMSQPKVVGSNKNSTTATTTSTSLVHFTHLPTANARFNPFQQLLKRIQKKVRQNQQAFAASFSGGMYSSFVLGGAGGTTSPFGFSMTTPNSTNTNVPLLSNFMETARTSQNQAVQLLIMKQLSETEPQTLLLAWANSMCQQSPLVKRMLDTKHYHFEKYQSRQHHHHHHNHNSKTSRGKNSSTQKENDDGNNINNFGGGNNAQNVVVLLSGGGGSGSPSSSAPHGGGTTSGGKHLTAKTKKAIQNEMTRVATRCSLGDPAILNQIIGTSPCLPTIDLPVRNFGVNFSSGDILLYLAQAMGCITLDDLRARYNVKELQSKEQQEKERIEIEKTLAMTGGGGNTVKRSGGSGVGGGANARNGNKAMTTMMAVGSCHPIVGRILRARVIDVAASSGISNVAMAEHELLLDALFAIIVLSDPWDKLDLAIRSLHDVFVDPHQTEFFLQLYRNKILEGLAPTELRQFLCKLLSSYSDFGVNPNIGMKEILMNVLGNANNNNNNSNTNKEENNHVNNVVDGGDDANSLSASQSSVVSPSSSDKDGTKSSSAAASASFFLNSTVENKRKPLTLLTAPFLALAKEQRNFQEQSWLCRLSNAISHEAISPNTMFPISLADSRPEIEELLMKCVASRVSRCQEWRDKWKHISSLVNEKFRKEDDADDLDEISNQQADSFAANVETDDLNRKSSSSMMRYSNRINNNNNPTKITAETQRELNALSLTHDQSLEAVLKKFETTYNLTFDNTTGRAIQLMERSTANGLEASTMMRGGNAASFLSVGQNNNNNNNNNNSSQQNLLLGASQRGTKGKSIMVTPGSPTSSSPNLLASSVIASKSTLEQGTIAISTDEIIKLNKSKIRKLEWPTYQILYPTIQRILHFNHNHNNDNNNNNNNNEDANNLSPSSPTSPLPSSSPASTFSYDRKIRSVFHSFATRSVASSVSGSSVSVGVHFGISHASFREFIVTNGFHTKPTNTGLSKRALGALYDLLLATRVTSREKNQRENPTNVFGKSSIASNNNNASFKMPKNTNNQNNSTRKFEVSFSNFASIEGPDGEDIKNAKTSEAPPQPAPLPSTRKRSFVSIPTIGLNLPRDDLDLPPGQLSLGDFSAIVAFVACSLAFADTKRAFDITLCLNHLRAVVEGLKPRPTTRRNERDVFQQSIDAFDVQAVFETHNNALRRAFVKTAAADGDPEMSLDEFMFVMRTTRLQVVVGADALRDIFARFAGGAEGSLLYRDFLDCLCVIAMYCDPSPFVPLSEKVGKVIKGPIAERSLPGLLSSMGVSIKS